jgi:hypothetical protein
MGRVGQLVYDRTGLRPVHRIDAEVYPAIRSLGRTEGVSEMLAALVLLVGLALLAGWEILCLGQVILAERVRFLPRWAWAVACLIFIPLGGALYLLIGRVWTHGTSRSAA